MIQIGSNNITATKDGKLLIRFGVQPYGEIESPRITVFDMLSRKWSECTLQCPLPPSDVMGQIYGYNAANLGADEESDELIVFGYIRKEMDSLKLLTMPRYLIELTAKWFVRETLVLLAVEFCSRRLMGHWYISMDSVLQSRKMI